MKASRRTVLKSLAMAGLTQHGRVHSAEKLPEVFRKSQKQDEKRLDCEILVAGGGMAGVCCALAAARCGSKVILVQDRPVLGGNASSEVRLHICGADCSGRRGIPLCTEAREGGILEELRLDNCVHNPQRSASMHDLILYDKCRREPNITLFLNTSVVGVKMSGTRIKDVICHRPSTEDIFRISAHIFVDCTGDGRLGYEAGAPFVQGREAKSVFNEKYAPEVADRQTLGSSLLFQAREYDKPMPFEAPPWARKFTEEDLRLRPHPPAAGELDYGFWWVEWGGQLDTIKDNETIRDELLSLFLGIWDHIKNQGDHGAECWALEWFGFLPGKRESRRFVGLYTLNENDVLSSRPFEDAIAYGGWPIDLHPPNGPDAKDSPRITGEFVPFLYDIPLRSCISCKVENLMFAGRNISCSHVAFGSTRVMGTCAVVGQGVGTAAALAVSEKLTPHRLIQEPTLVRKIQQRLLRDDAYLIGFRNSDPADKATIAHITASSETEDAPAHRVVSGQSRSVHGERGAPPDRAFPGTHRWMSNAEAGLPAWLELRWDEPIKIREVQLIFDTGLHRLLTLRHYPKFAEAEFWGKPQPETVKDYTLEGDVEGNWVPLVSVVGNYQRRRVHSLTMAQPVHALRISIASTNGIDHARICEVRVYD